MENIKQKIIKKYGTVSRFCRLSGIDRKTIQNYFDKGMGKQDMSMRWQAFELVLWSTVKGTSNEVEDIVITEKDRNRLRSAIVRDYNGKVQLFADVHGFDYTNVQQVLSGFRKRKTGIVKTILKAGV
jgi:hypothetical protein